MTPLMETLYRYLVETKLDAFLLQYPEYPDYLRCAGEKEGQLRARLEPGEARLLDDLLGELRLGHATGAGGRVPGRPGPVPGAGGAGVEAAQGVAALLLRALLSGGLFGRPWSSWR